MKLKPFAEIDRRHITELESGYDPLWAEKLQIARANKNAALEENKGLMLAIRKYEAHITALEDEKAELVKRVRHASWCLGVPNGIGKHPCTCGLDELLSKQEQE